MKRWFLTILLLLVLGCSTAPAADGFPIAKVPVAGHTLSCKGMRCCWPWDDEGRIVVCVEPLEGNYLGAGGVMITVRGKMP